MTPKSRGLHEVESDCNKTFQLLAGCFDVADPSAETWRTAARLCERLAEEVGRAFALAHMREATDKIRAMCPPPSERESR